MLGMSRIYVCPFVHISSLLNMFFSFLNSHGDEKQESVANDKPHQATYIYLVPHYLLVEKLYTYYACMACPIIKLLDKHVQ